MPTYDYECQGCGHTFEVFQSITGKALRKCPQCKKLRLRRLIGIGAGVIFKGSGFYETDYRSESYKKGAKEEKEAVKKASESKDGKAEKSDAKADKSDSKSTKKKDGTSKKKSSK